MKLKPRANDYIRDMDVCQQATCKRPTEMLFDPGVRFPESEGTVGLCAYHADPEKRGRPPKKAAEPAILVKPEPVALVKAEPAADVPEVRLAAEAQEASEILALVRKFEIVTPEDMAFANECLGEIKAKLKALDAEKKGATAPMNEALKKVRGWFKPAEDFYAAAEKAWKERIAVWTLAQAQAQQKALEAVQAAHAAGDVLAVAQAMTKAGEATVELPSNVTVRERWFVSIVEPELVPVNYWAPSQALLEKAVSMGARDIPGCKIWREDQVIRRA